jgi:hypothetical protein
MTAQFWLYFVGALLAISILFQFFLAVEHYGKCLLRAYRRYQVRKEFK